MVRAGRKRTAISACGCAGGVGRQQPQLHLARHGDVALQLPLLAAHRLVEPRILDGDGDLRGQRGQHALVLFVEEAGARVFQVEHADDAALVEQRHDQLRAGLRVHGQVALVLAHVGHVDRPPLAHRRAHQAAVDGNAAQWARARSRIATRSA